MPEEKKKTGKKRTGKKEGAQRTAEEEDAGFQLLFERAVNRTIPILVILLAIVLILDNPFWTIYNLEHFGTAMFVFDAVIFFFFFADLVFKWRSVKKLDSFIRLYWIDIVAVFPFYLGFRAYQEVAYFFEVGGEIAESTQKLAHEAIILKESEMLKEAREAKPVLKAIKSVSKLIKIFKGRMLLTHWHLHDISRKHKAGQSRFKLD